MSKYVIVHGQLRELSDDELMHYGIKGQKWGVRRYQDEDGSLTQLGRSRLRGYDDVNDDDIYSYSDRMQKAEAYANSWERKYGSVPINRLRFEYDDDRYSSGRDYCSDYDWNRTSLDKIYDSYNEYRESEKW